MGPSLLEQLREQTRPAHLALEAQPSLKRLMSSQVTEREYGQLLQAFLAFYQSLESVLMPAADALLARYPDPDYRYQLRAPLLADDCQVLGCDAPALIPPPIELGTDGNDARLLGVLYVIEGSTQGGRLITSHLARTLGVGEQSGVRFFSLYRRTHSWAAFRRWLDRGLADSYRDDIARVVEGADMTFAALRNHLDRWPLVTHE